MSHDKVFDNFGKDVPGKDPATLSMEISHLRDLELKGQKLQPMTEYNRKLLDADLALNAIKHPPKPAKTTADHIRENSLKMVAEQMANPVFLEQWRWFAVDYHAAKKAPPFGWPEGIDPETFIKQMHGLTADDRLINPPAPPARKRTFLDDLEDAAKKK